MRDVILKVVDAEEQLPGIGRICLLTFLTGLGKTVSLTGCMESHDIKHIKYRILGVYEDFIIHEGIEGELTSWAYLDKHESNFVF